MPSRPILKMKSILIGVLLAVVPAASVLAIPLEEKKTAAIDNPCPSTNKSRDWSSDCFEPVGSDRQVKKVYRQNIHINTSGYAAILTGSPPKLIAVSKTGSVVPLSRKHLTDFFFERSNDVARFGYMTSHGDKEYRSRCGYYRGTKFEIVIPPIYDGCAQMREGRALVCNQCVNRCRTAPCHARDFLGNDALIINEKGEILEKIKLASPVPTAD